MAEAGASGRKTSLIGEVVAPPFVRLPDPALLFAQRAMRFRALAAAGDLAPYLNFLGSLADVQHAIQDGLPAVGLPADSDLERAHEHAMPPLDRARFTADATFDETITRLLAHVARIAMPEAGKAALERVAGMDAAGRAALCRAVLDHAVPAESVADHVFPAAALQVHFARLAAGLDPGKLVPVGDGACPSCGGPPVASLIVDWPRAQGARFCACALCQTQWNYVRAKCVACGSLDQISFREVEGDAGLVKAESCGACGCYVKAMYQQKDPNMDPIADDVASLGLDLLMRETGTRRAAVNPFLVGY